MNPELCIDCQEEEAFRESRCWDCEAAHWNALETEAGEMDGDYAREGF